MNYRVADLRALIDALQAECCNVLGEIAESEYGKFAWVLDERRMLTRCDAILAAQLTYNRRTLIGDGCMEMADRGLSRLGRGFVAEVNRLRMLLDLSHAGPLTIADGIAARGWKTARIEKILGGNFARLFRDVWTA